MGAETDRSISTLPDGLWTQPAPTVPELGVDEPVQRVRMPAAMVRCSQAMRAGGVPDGTK